MIRAEHLKCVKNSGIMGYDAVFLGEWFCSPATHHHFSEEMNLQKTPLNVKSCTGALNTTVVICMYVHAES
jgi:hypothetical protein